MALEKHSEGPFREAYRPQTIGEMYDTFDKAALEHHVCSKDHSHVYFFSGESGLGKTTLAKILARRFMCEDPKGADPCGVCEKCRNSELYIRQENMADKTKIDDTRRLISELSAPPLNGGARCAIFDESHRMVGAAQHAWLAVLEDPPAHLYVFFCTMEPKKFERALRERSHQIEMRPLTKSPAYKLVQDVAAKEKLDVTDEMFERIWNEVGGVPRSILNELQNLRDGRTIGADEQKDIEEKLMYPFIKSIVHAESWSNVSTLYRRLLAQKGDAERLRIDLGNYCYAVSANPRFKVSRAGTKVMMLIEGLSEPMYGVGDHFVLFARMFRVWQNVRELG